MSKLKLVTTTSTSTLHIIQREGEDPVLAYKSGNNVIKLDKGGSPDNRLLDCSTLYNLLSRYFIKGTKFIISTYNPVLYYLFPGDPTYDDMFNPSTGFIPTLKVSDLVRGEVDGFSAAGISQIKAGQTRSIKACDSWYNNPAEEEKAVEAVDDLFKDVFGFYKEFSDLDIEKEVHSKLGDYSVDLSGIVSPISVDLVPSTMYTDTLNLEDWVYACGVSGDLKARLDVYFMYSIRGTIYSGSQTIEAFRYSGGNLVSGDSIVRVGRVQLEYIGRVLKIYPVDSGIDEIIINDACLTIGV